MGGNREGKIRLLYITEDSSGMDGFQRALTHQSDFTVTMPSETEEDLKDVIDCIVWNHGESDDWVTEIQ